MWVSLAVVVIWTARLARSKGLNPWLWAGASVLLLLIPDWRILGMLPMVFLLFYRRPRAQDNPLSTAEVTCPKCNATQTANHNFCDTCGWELIRPYLEEPTRQEERFPTITREADPPAGPAVAEAPPVREATPEAETPAPVAPTPEEAAATAAPGESGERVAQPETAEAPQRQFTGPPTPTSMTERGLALFQQGRFQEAIDQFTKAIALDPSYRLAWESRAEAYNRMGRAQQAAEDRRRLEAI